MRKILTIVLLTAITGCATLNTTVGQVQLPVETAIAPLMRAPNAAWNCYVNIPRCLAETNRKK